MPVIECRPVWAAAELAPQVFAQSRRGRWEGFRRKIIAARRLLMQKDLRKM